MSFKVTDFGTNIEAHMRLINTNLPPILQIAIFGHSSCVLAPDGEVPRDDHDLRKIIVHSRMAKVGPTKWHRNISEN